MPNRSSRKITTCVLLLISLSFLVMPGQWSGHCQQLVASAVAPFQRILSTPARAISNTATNLSNAWTQGKENEDLKQELRNLRSQLAQKQAVISRKDRKIHALSGFSESYPDRKAILANVIGRSSSDMRKIITLDRGRADGVEEGSPVVWSMNHPLLAGQSRSLNDDASRRKSEGQLDRSSLVGRVFKVGPSTCAVLLITDPECRMLARISSSQDEGILEGTSGATCRIKYVKRNRNIRINDDVICTDFPQLFPKGLPVGLIVNVDMKRTSLLANIDVSPFVDLDRLESVIIVK